MAPPLTCVICGGAVTASTGFVVLGHETVHRVEACLADFTTTRLYRARGIAEKAWRAGRSTVAELERMKRKVAELERENGALIARATTAESVCATLTMQATRARSERDIARSDQAIAESERDAARREAALHQTINRSAPPSAAPPVSPPAATVAVEETKREEVDASAKRFSLLELD